MANYTMKNPNAEATYAQVACIGDALIEVLFEGKLTKGEASEIIGDLKNGRKDERVREILAQGAGR